MTTTTRKPATRKRLADMTPAEQLQTQIARVAKLGLRVVGHGTFKADGSPFWLVPSTSEKLKNMHHVVRKTAKGLACDCYASSESGLICPHRACVYLELKRQAEAAKNAPKLPAPTAHEQASRAPAVASMASRAAAALPADHTPAAFSIFKSDTPAERRYQTLEDEYAARDGYASSDHYQHAYR